MLPLAYCRPGPRDPALMKITVTQLLNPLLDRNLHAERPAVRPQTHFKSYSVPWVPLEVPLRLAPRVIHLNSVQ